MANLYWNGTSSTQRVHHHVSRLDSSHPAVSHDNHMISSGVERYVSLHSTTTNGLAERGRRGGERKGGRGEGEGEGGKEEEKEGGRGREGRREGGRDRKRREEEMGRYGRKI